MNGPVVFVPSVPNHQQPPRHAFVVGRLVVGYALWMQAGFTCLGPPTTKPQAKPWTKKNQNTWPGPCDIHREIGALGAWRISLRHQKRKEKLESCCGTFFLGGGTKSSSNHLPTGLILFALSPGTQQQKQSFHLFPTESCLCLFIPRGGLANKQSIVFGMIHTNSAAHREGYRGTI